MLSLYTPPNEELSRKSFGVVLSCMYQGQNNLLVVDAKCIRSVVALVPFPDTSPCHTSNPPQNGPFYVVEKMGMDVACMGGIMEVDDAE